MQDACLAAVAALSLAGWIGFACWAFAAERVEARRHEHEMDKAYEDREWAINREIWARTDDKPAPVDATQEDIRQSLWRTRIGLFLALLELAREQRVRVRQEKPGDAIELELRDSVAVPNQASASSNAAP